MNSKRPEFEEVLEQARAAEESKRQFIQKLRKRAAISGLIVVAVLMVSSVIRLTRIVSSDQYSAYFLGIVLVTGIGLLINKKLGGKRFGLIQILLPGVVFVACDMLSRLL